MDSQTQTRQTGRLADHRFVSLLNRGRDGGETLALNSSYSLIGTTKREIIKKWCISLWAVIASTSGDGRTTEGGSKTTGSRLWSQ